MLQYNSFDIQNIAMKILLNWYIVYMELNNTGKKFVYVSIIFMALSMGLPWESLEDYTYGEVVGLALNVIPAVLFICSSFIVVIPPIASLLSRIGTNYVFLMLCLINAIARQKPWCYCRLDAWVMFYWQLQRACAAKR